MSVDFRTVSVTIPKGTGSRSIDGKAKFNSKVLRAGVALNGFKLDYSSKDHHVNIVEADTDFVSIKEDTVNFRVECFLADKNLDDPYSGYVTALVTAEVV